MKTHNPITNKDYIPGAGLWPEEQTQRNAPACGGRSRAQLRERLQLHMAPPAASQGCFSLPPSFSSLSLVFYALFSWYVLWGAASMLLGLDVQHRGCWSGSAQHGAAQPLLTDPPETPAAPGHWHAAQQGRPITHIIPHTVCCTSRWPVLRGTAGEAFRLLPNTQLAGAGLPSRRHLLLAHRGPQEPGNALPYPTSLPSSHTQRCHSGCTRGKNTTWLKLEVREMSRAQAQLHFSCTHLTWHGAAERTREALNALLCTLVNSPVFSF